MPKPSCKVDIFSAAVIFYELLANKCLFTGTCEFCLKKFRKFNHLYILLSNAGLEEKLDSAENQVQVRFTAPAENILAALPRSMIAPRM